MKPRHLQAVLTVVLVAVVFEGNTIRPRLRPEKPAPPRDYRPSKWIANSAMDVWYGNKTMIDIMSREFLEVLNKMVLRPARAAVDSSNEIFSANATSIDLEEQARSVLLLRINDTISKVISLRKDKK